MKENDDDTEKRKMDKVAKSPTKQSREKGSMDETDDQEKGPRNQGHKKKIRSIDDWIINQKDDAKKDADRIGADNEALKQMQAGQEGLDTSQDETKDDDGNSVDRVLFPKMPAMKRKGAKIGEKWKNVFNKMKDSKDSKKASKQGHDEKEGVLKTSVSFADQPPSHTLIIEFVVPVEYEKGKKTIELFQEKIHKVLAFVREHAGDGKTNFLILPKDKNRKKKPLKDKNSFPSHQIGWMKDYGEFDNKYAFSPLNPHFKNKTLRGSLRVGANMDIDELLETVGYHVYTDFRVTLKAKGVQVIKTASTHMILGLSTKIGLGVVKTVTDKVLKQLEGDTEKPWIQYCVHLGWPGGMPFTEKKAGQQTEDNGRQTFIFQVDAKDESRFAGLLQKAKQTHAWNGIWGARMITLEMVPNRNNREAPELEGKRHRYQKAVRQHGSMQLSTGLLTLPGVIDCNKIHSLRRFSPEGVPKEPVKRSVRSIMEGLEKDGQNIWILVTEISEGVIGGFFSSIIPDVKIMAREWSTNPAVQIYWSLVRRGVVEEDVRKFLAESFETSELLKIEKSRWSKTKRQGVVDHGDDLIDLEMMLKDKSTVDFNKGLSPEEKREMRIDDGIHYGEVKAGNMAAYNFGAGDSVKTTTPGKVYSTPPARVADTDSFAKSTFSFDAKTTIARSTVIEDESSISSFVSLESMEQKQVSYASKKEEEQPVEMEGSQEKNRDKVLPSEASPIVDGSREKEQEKGMDAEDPVNPETVDEEMARMISKTLNILVGSEKEKFKKMENKLQMKYMEYLLQADEEGLNHTTEEKEARKDNPVLNEEHEGEDPFYEAYCKITDEKFDSKVKNPVTWMDYLHNQWRSMELMEQGCTNILEIIENNEKLEEMGYHKDEIHLEDLVEPELESLILDSGETPQEIHTCVYEWREKLRNYAAVVKNNQASKSQDDSDAMEEDEKKTKVHLKKTKKTPVSP